MDVVKLKPICKDYLWGGTSLIKANKDNKLSTIAESWELAINEYGNSYIASGKYIGKPLKDVISKQDLGSKAIDFNVFPTLIKLLDTSKELSIQVHPDDKYAMQNEHSLGKEEMWHILDCKEDSYIYLGFNKDMSKAEIVSRIDDGTLSQCLNKIKVHKNDTFIIPFGIVHALGKNILCYEVQENSNVTYRLYDYNRVDKNGLKRELHISKALDVTSLSKFEFNKIDNNNGNILAKSKYFSVSKEIADEKISSPNDSFMVITILEGEGKINGINFKPLDSFFFPKDKEANLSCKIKYMKVTL